MRIGIDIDDTLLDTSKSFDKVIKKYNVNFSKKLNEKWTVEESDFIYKNYLFEVLVNAKPKEKSQEVVKKLQEEGHKLYIITARGNVHCKNIEEETLKIIKNLYNIDEFYFGYFNKQDIANSLNLDLMIDDNISVYNSIKNVGIDCILFGDTIKTWDSVLKYIESGD